MSGTVAGAFVVGTIFGLIVMALINAAAREDDRDGTR